jgi:hypothetical protein
VRKKIVLKRKGSQAGVLSVHEVRQDFLRNARSISQSEEPAFVHEFEVPEGARRMRVVTRRTDLEVSFLR